MAHLIGDSFDDVAEDVKRAWHGLFGDDNDEPDANSPRTDYAYDHDTIVKPWPMLMTDPHFPKEQEPTLVWFYKVVKVVFGIVVNRALWPADPSSSGVDYEKVKVDLSHIGVGTVSGRAAIVSDDAIYDLARSGKPKDGGQQELHSIANALRGLSVLDPWHIFNVLMQVVKPKPRGRPKSLDDYDGLFVTQKRPALSENYRNDQIFADLRVAGFNPVVIKQVAGVPQRFPVTDTMLARATNGSDSLNKAGKEGRLFLADYSLLARADMGNFPAGPKHVFAPLALFALPPGTGTRKLVPVAIQSGPEPADFPVITPLQKDLWGRARTAVQQADATYHELISHLGGCHLLMEPFAIATHNQLTGQSDPHPIGHLLTPHFEGTLFINEGALKGLITSTGQISMVLAPTSEASNLVAVESLITGEYFNNNMLPTHLKNRGVMSPDLYYPYRDDAISVWDAIHEWVRNYVSIFYTEDKEVESDPFLQKWMGELISSEGGRVKGLGEKDINGVFVSGKLTTIDYLLDVLTMVIFTASAGHATFNFSQPEMTYAPAVPGAAYRSVPIHERQAKVMPVLDQLPPLEMARLQMEFLTLLGSVHHTKLGYYGGDWPLNRATRQAMQQFQKSLEQVKAKIEDRNQSRSPKYNLLNPDLIPQSINI